MVSTTRMETRETRASIRKKDKLKFFMITQFKMGMLAKKMIEDNKQKKEAKKDCYFLHL